MPVINEFKKKFKLLISRHLADKLKLTNNHHIITECYFSLFLLKLYNLYHTECYKEN